MSTPAISTPCVKVCGIDPLSGLCIGCGRTVAEIAAWGAMSEAERLAVMAGLDQRMEHARSRAAQGGASSARGRSR